MSGVASTTRGRLDVLPLAGVYRSRLLPLVVLALVAGCEEQATNQPPKGPTASSGWYYQAIVDGNVSDDGTTVKVAIRVGRTRCHPRLKREPRDLDETRGETCAPGPARDVKVRLVGSHGKQIGKGVTNDAGIFELEVSVEALSDAGPSCELTVNGKEVPTNCERLLVLYNSAHVPSAAKGTSHAAAEVDAGTTREPVTNAPVPGPCQSRADRAAYRLGLPPVYPAASDEAHSRVPADLQGGNASLRELISECAMCNAWTCSMLEGRPARKPATPCEVGCYQREDRCRAPCNQIPIGGPPGNPREACFGRCTTVLASCVGECARSP